MRSRRILVISYPYPSLLLIIEEKLNSNPYLVNSGIIRQSQDRFGLVPMGMGFIAMSKANTASLVMVWSTRQGPPLSSNYHEKKRLKKSYNEQHYIPFS